MTNAPLPGGDATPLDIGPIKARYRAYIDAGWAYYPPAENGWSDFESRARHFYAETPRDIPALLAEIERLQAQLILARQQVTEAEALREYDAERLIGLAGRNAELRAEVTALQQERDELHAELTGTLSDAFKAIPVCYDTLTDHYREMARRIVEDRDALKHENRTLKARAEAAEQQVTAIREGKVHS